MFAKFCFSAFAAVLLSSAAARADDAACQAVRDASAKTHNVSIKVTGYNFSNDTPAIYGTGTEVCARVRDEAVNGKPATLYTWNFSAPAGSTHSKVWVSKANGTLLRAEEDGDVKGKGHGHLSITPS